WLPPGSVGLLHQNRGVLVERLTLEERWVDEPVHEHEYDSDDQCADSRKEYPADLAVGREGQGPVGAAVGVIPVVVDALDEEEGQSDSAEDGHDALEQQIPPALAQVVTEPPDADEPRSARSRRRSSSRGRRRCRPGCS